MTIVSSGSYESPCTHCKEFCMMCGYMETSQKHTAVLLGAIIIVFEKKYFFCHLSFIISCLYLGSFLTSSADRVKVIDSTSTCLKLAVIFVAIASYVLGDLKAFCVLHQKHY